MRTKLAKREDQITNELAAALQNILDQIYQMQDMFEDEDSTIANSIEEAEIVLHRYKDSLKATKF